MNTKSLAPTSEILAAVAALQSFTGDGLTSSISKLEKKFQGANASVFSGLLSSVNVSHDLLESAHLLKQVAGQINVVIHAVGILLALSHLLAPAECVEYLSLGAGNTGKPFDLETDRRVAEFKFIHWQGGSEVIRQNALFKDFYLMAEHDTPKAKFLYVIGTEYPLKFLNGGRALTSVMSRHRKMWDDFTGRYGNRFATVREYYATKRHAVELVDLGQFLPQLAQAIDE